VSLSHEKIFDKFHDAMVKYTKTLRIGEGDKPDVLRANPKLNAV
jgi:hypothetical protein